MKNVLFLGLTHIGQVYASNWAKKIGKCAVFDFNKKNLTNFKNKKYTSEEPKLKKINNEKKIIFLNHKEQIPEYKLIFFTYDTPIKKKNGYPDIYAIEKIIRKLLSLNIKKKTTLIITSQVYPGFMEKIKKKYLTKKINLIYMVDTLKMGTASKNFLFPDRLIFGGLPEYKSLIKNIFKKFKCKKYLFSYTESELIKISINLYLFFSVSYANIMDMISRTNKTSFSKILNPLKDDKRIGKYSYIEPSLGIAGGHLERDAYYFKKISRDISSKKIIGEMIKFNNKRKILLEEEIKNINNSQISSILIVGFSYKKDSFSIVNSPFANLLKNKKFNVSVYDDYYQLPKIKNLNKINNLNSLKKFNILIYNYSNKKSLKLIKRHLKNIKKIHLINMSMLNSKIFNEKNIKNIFCDPIKHIK